MEKFKDFYIRYLRYFLSKDNQTATDYDKYLALVYAVRSQMVDRWIETQNYYHEHNVRRVYYLSLEYIFGRCLVQNIVNSGLSSALNAAAEEFEFSFDDIVAQEDPFDLGNGGKGRLAACFQESMATLNIPALAYGIRYDYAQFRQEIYKGQQIEKPYDWLHKGHPWEIIRPEYFCSVEFGGTSSIPPEYSYSLPAQWNGSEHSIAIPYDFPIPGYQNKTVNTLRLWSARAVEEFAPEYYNRGDYIKACEERSLTGRSTRMLFTEEDVRRATTSRLRQQFFYISASLQDIIRRYKQHNVSMLEFDKKVAIQLNGSRCALAVPELMRLLVDIEMVPWDDAWRITKNVFAYTSHAVQNDDLEVWPVYMLEQNFPRHMQIMYEINQRHLDTIRASGATDDVIYDLSIIEEGEVKRVRLALLAVLGSSVINGVSGMQTGILRKSVFKRVSSMLPVAIESIPNGVAHRRWMVCSNPELSELITKTIGDAWIRDAGQLSALEQYAEDEGFREALEKIKQHNKERFCQYARDTWDVDTDPAFLFDVQVNKIHPYKRQVLHIMYIINSYLQLKSGKECCFPRLHIFAGKAMPSDFFAKQIVRLITATVEIINSDPETEKKMRVLFIPDFGMSELEQLMTVTDLYEKISTPHLEACGTSNMKFGLNGALSLLSRGGANIEMIERVGEENLFTIGRESDWYAGRKEYEPGEVIKNNEKISAVLSFLEDTLRTLEFGETVFPLLASLRDSDRYGVLFDFEEYCVVQQRIDSCFTDRNLWLKKVIRSLSRMGWFSIDRAVREYAKNTWKVNVDR
jgi:starch phosphorylase